MGNISQFRHREVRWEGLIMIAKQTITVFWGKKVGCDRANSPLYEPGVHLRFEIWTSTSFLVYIDNIYGLHLKGQTQILSQNWNWFIIYSHNFILKWVMACQWLFDISHLLRIQINNICTMIPREYILEQRYLFIHFSIF